MNRPLVAPPNIGTPQFWKIFHSCANRVAAHSDFAGIQASVPAAARIASKLALLQRLRELGVWLLDTSIAALYSPKRPKPAPALIECCLQVSWDYYVRRLVESAEPAHIICIGRGVARALRARLSNIGVPITVLAQPNARLASAEHFQSFQTYYRVVQDANRHDLSSPAV